MSNNLLSRMLGRDKWLSTEASVYSVDYRAGGRYQPNGLWDVVYTYRVDGEIQTGQYSEGASGPEEPYFLKPDDTLDIRYNPAHPAKSFNPNVDPISLYGWTPWLIGAAFAIVVGLVALLRSSPAR